MPFFSFYFIENYEITRTHSSTRHTARFRTPLTILSLPQLIFNIHHPISASTGHSHNFSAPHHLFPPSITIRHPFSSLAAHSLPPMPILCLHRPFSVSAAHFLPLLPIFCLCCPISASALHSLPPPTFFLPYHPFSSLPTILSTILFLFSSHYQF